MLIPFDWDSSKEHTVSIYAWSTLPLGLNNAPPVAGLLIEAEKGEAKASL
jgi:hypothetical protein